ncbi:MAG: fatty acid desaturase [Planctomycetes bacterium]|nr:fatty acid desaturase [Planctomycetota bacterium]
MAASLVPTAIRLRDPRDRVSVALALGHVAVFAVWPSLAVVAFGMWWNANTISHRFVHRSVFRARLADDLYSLLLSLLLGVPQRIWRQRHLAHHAERRWVFATERGLTVEAIAVASLWAVLAVAAPAFFLAAYLPGLVIGHGLCWLQGHYEHAGGTTSCYARWWNLLFLNDGYHVEHHAAPGRRFEELPAHRIAGARNSAWPPVLRWLDGGAPRLLDALERVVLAVPWLQRRVLAVHRAPLRSLLERCRDVRTAVVVGGGLFPRTAILLRELLPDAQITIQDADASHVERARPLIPDGVRVVAAPFAPGSRIDADLVVLPLALRGARAACYASPAARHVLVHDWLWRPRGTTAVVAVWLAKRINLIERDAAAVRVAG